jgi:hypothetical protein
MLTNNFYTHLAGLLKNEPGLSGSFFIAVGGGDPNWDTSLPDYDRARAALVDEITRKEITLDNIRFIDVNGVETLTPTTHLRFDTRFELDEGIGAWRECGLFFRESTNEPGPGRLLSYFIYPRIEKTNAMTMSRTIDLDLSPTAAGMGHIVTRYLGNSHTLELHDLNNITGSCQVDEIRSDRKIYFGSIEQALALGYDYCGFCFGSGLSQR